jgi:predicted RNase H-like nuclease
MRVAGVDGCRGGWAIAHFQAGRIEFEIVPDFAGVIARTRAAIMVAIDMPIGLADHVGPGGRGPDAAARRVLGARQSSIFAVPSRAAVQCTDYRDACEAALATSNPPRKVSKQCFHLFPKIREVDAAMTPALQARIVETHPETAFWAMNGETPLGLPKKVKSEPHAPGLALRRALLERTGVALGAFSPKAGIATEDDFIDAAACAVAALRVAKGEARRFPEAPARDAKGLRMEIWA